jgi:beta-galactosidase
MLLAGMPARAEKNDNMYAPQAAAAPYINFDSNGFIVNGQRTWIASGSIHYPRVPQELWIDRILRLKRSGLDCVETYAFPNYHWTAGLTATSGSYTFTGNGDLNQYLQDINSLGLYAVVRAGLYVCSEWDNGGYPQWLLLEPGMSMRGASPPNFLTASDQWYGSVMPIVSANQINKGGSVIMVQLDNEHPTCWGVDYDNLTYFQHLLSTALADGIQVPMWFSGLHHSADPAGTTSWDSVGRQDPWFTDEFWAGWFSYYGNSGNDLTTIDRGTWKIMAYGGNGYNYYMFHGGSNFDHWPSGGVGASYDYGAAVGEAGDLRTSYYRDKRAALFARTFQTILENSTKADASYAGAATGVTAINARTSPAGTIVFLDNDTANTSTATLTDGAQITLDPYEIAPVVENYALTNWLTIKEADGRIFGSQPQGSLTTLVMYGDPGETVRTQFALTSGTATSADTNFAVSSGTNAIFTAPVVDGTCASFQLTSGTNTLRLLLLSKAMVDRTWFVSSSGSNYVVSGPDYVGSFTNPNNRVDCTLEEPLGNSLPTNIVAYGGDQLALHTLTITSQVASGTPAAPALVNWQMRSGTAQAAVGYDDSSWYTTTNPQVMGSDGDTSNYAWYRAEPTVATSGTYYLALPAIYDAATLFVNGKLAPTQPALTGTAVPVPLQSGTNTLAIFTAHYGRESFYVVTGTSEAGFSVKGLQGGAALGGTPLTNWYWLNTGTNTAPTAASIVQVTGTGFDPAANGWSTGTGWNGDVLTGAGYAWYRTNLPSLPGPHSVFFSNVGDNCTVYLNGTNVVGTSYAVGVPFTVSLDNYWSTSGTNVLTVLVQDVGGEDENHAGINGGVLMNPLAGAIPNWKLQGGLGTIEGPNITWAPVGTTGSTPTFYHAQFNYQPPPGVLPILRAGYAGLSAGHIWLNGHSLGRYPEVIPISGLYLPECWLSATNNTLDYFDEKGAAPTGVSLFVETAASRQVYQAQDINEAMIYPPEMVIANGQNGKVSLTWSTVAGAAGYDVQRATQSGGPYTLVGTNVTGLTFLDTGVTNGTTYYYVVSGENAGSETSNSAEVSATPTLVVAQFTNPGFELPGTGKISSGFATIPGWANAGSTYSNSGVENTPTSHGGSYHAFCKGSDSGCYQMTNYQIQAGDTVTLTWWAEHTGGSGTSSQNVSMLGAPAANAAYANTTPLVTNTSALNGNGSSSGPWAQYTLTYNATASDVGNYVGMFFNNATFGNWAGFDDFSISVASAPNPPANLTATSGSGEIALSWVPLDNVSSYNLKRSEVSGTYPTTYSLTGTSYTDSGLTNGTTYYYVISAVNGQGEGPNSNEISATPSVPVSAAEIESAQMSATGNQGGSTTMVVKVSAPGHTYTLQYCANLGTGTWTNIGTVVVGTGGNIQLTPVVNKGTMGFYRVLIQRE